MAIINYPLKEITIKIVYYGPGLSGKTTSLKYVYENIPKDKKGKMVTISTEGDRTLFFDFLPVDMGKIGDFNLRLQLYTVPGQVFYENTRVLVLQQTDAVIFVADSQKDMLQSNIESFNGLFRNLKKNNIDPEKIPIVIMYNKRDLSNILPVSELNKELNTKGYPYFETSAITGLNVMEALKLTIKLAIESLKKRYNIKEKQTDETIFYQREGLRKEEDKEKAEEKGDVIVLDEEESKDEVIELSMDEDEEVVEEFPEDVEVEEKPSEDLEKETDFSEISMESEIKLDATPDQTVMFDRGVVVDESKKGKEIIDNVFEGVEDVKKGVEVDSAVNDTAPEQVPDDSIEEVLFSKEIEIELPFTVEKNGKDVSLKLKLKINLVR